MKVSVNWLRDINLKYKCSAEPMPEGVDKLVERIGAQLGAVDEVTDLGKKYEGIVVAKIVSCEKHPNADKLSVCLIDDGGVAKGVKRDKEGLVQVVCGAPNAKATLAVAWIPPGVAVPSTIDKDPFVLESREIRGVISNGMLASPKELSMGDNHEGILEITEKVKPGQAFAAVYGLDDYIIDIENKMFTHRPDLFGTLGVAREVAGIQGHVFKSPDWYRADARIPAPKVKKIRLAIKNDVPKLVPRFCLAAAANIKVAPSPMWLQARLSRVGIRPVNNIVDVTNYLMLETAQPLHAYDYDKLVSHRKGEVQIGVRMSKKGEALKLLGGKTVHLHEPAIVITDGSRPIGLGGVMGGADTEVDEKTKNIILECGSFDMNAIRGTAMKYGLFTDAATRFTKNQSPLQNMAVLARAVDAVQELAGGQLAGEAADYKAAGLAEQPKSVRLGTEFINSRLGLELKAAQVKTILENVEFSVDVAGDKLVVKVPFWRTDIGIPEDIVEEVGRLHGYDRLPVVLPWRELAPPTTEPLLSLKAGLRGVLKAGGANEVLTYSFVHGNLIDKAGQDREQAFHIRNALSPELQYYRLSLTPSLLSQVHANIKAGHEHFAVYELGRAHVRSAKDSEKLPAELHRLSIAVAGKRPAPGASYYQAKRFTDYLLNELHIQCRYLPLSEFSDLDAAWRQTAGSFEPVRSAVIVSERRQVIGLVGEPTQTLKQGLKLPTDISQAELDTELLGSLAPATPPYTPLYKYPRLEQDICLRLASDTDYQTATDLVLAHMEKSRREHGYESEVSALDIFQKKNDTAHKQITWRIRLWHPERTLTTEETNRLLDGLADAAKRGMGAQRI